MADYDLCIIGGGIQGAGIARDAARRGLKVLLCEKGDYASATSSVSSKLIHGGLRYLERADLRLVYESLHERAILMQTAPHMVRPLSFIIPFLSDNRRRPWMYRLGLTLYDLLAGHQLLPKHRSLDRAACLREAPQLDAARLGGGVTYFDCQVNDARLVLLNIIDALRQGAHCFNYAEVTSIKSAPQGGFDIEWQHEGKSQRAHSRYVVNCAGPWVDSLARLTGGPAAAARAPWVTMAKGVHLIMSGSMPLSPQHALLLEIPREKRIFFVLPWEGMTLVGTTDTEFRGNPENIPVEADDIRYLKRAMQQHLAPHWLTSHSIVGGFAGVRPLTYEGGRQSRDISRDYRIVEEPGDFFSVIGGKYTVYRKIAELVVDRIARRRAVQERLRPCTTRTQPLPGGDYLERDNFGNLQIEVIRKEWNLSPASANHLWRTYGNEWRAITDFGRQNPELLRPLTPELPQLAAEVVHAIRNEHAQTLEDFLLRRTHLGYQADHGRAALPTIKEIFRREGREQHHPRGSLVQQEQQWWERWQAFSALVASV